MADRQRPTCSPQQASLPANKEGNSSDSSPPSKGEDTPTPTRKNKRKMSEPRKRTDVSSKRFCLDDKISQIYDDEEDDMMIGVQRLPVNTPEPSPSSDERDNSTGADHTPSPSLIPPVIPSQLLGGAVPAIYHTPVLTNVGGIPRYALVPSVAPGYFAAPRFGHPGLTLTPVSATTIPTITQLSNTSEETKSHKGNIIHGNNNNNNNNIISKDCPVTSNCPVSTNCPVSVPSPSPSISPDLEDQNSNRGSRKQRKNYKNMTRERRVEANARERTRVHTISAAFESLRRAVPSYSYHQRLSKLAILRIACSYILALSRLADMDYSEEQNEMSFSECVDLCTQTIQSEGRAKRRH